MISSVGPLDIRDIEEQLGTGIYVWSPADDQLFWSPGLLRLYGSDTAPNDERGFDQFLHPDDRVRVEGETSTFLSSDARSFSHCFRIVRPDGAVRAILDRGVIERDERGSVLVIRGMNVDITDIVATTNSHVPSPSPAFTLPAQASELFPSQLHEPGSPRPLDANPVCVFEQDMELRYLWSYNPRLGLSVAPVFGKTDFDLIDSITAEKITSIKRHVLETRAPDRRQIVLGADAQDTKFLELAAYPRLNTVGEVVGLAGVSSEGIRRETSPESRQTADEVFRQLVDRSPFGVYVVNSDFLLMRVSEGAQKVFSNIRPLLGQDFAKVIRQIWPEPFATDVILRFQHTLQTGEVYHAPNTVETRADVPQVEAYDWKIERVTLPDGRPGVVCHFYDLSERHRYEKHIQTIMDEVNHRAKNLLGLVQSIAHHTLRTNPLQFEDRFSMRLKSLMDAQDLLVKSGSRSVSIADLLVTQIGHLIDLMGSRIRWDGPDVQLTPRAAESLGMALHELATNATKYGALSNGEGQITIQWALTEENGELIFSILWKEQGGPPVQQPTKAGFGSTVTGRALEMGLEGKTRIEYQATGLVWMFRCDARVVAVV